MPCRLAHVGPRSSVVPECHTSAGDRLVHAMFEESLVVHMLSRRNQSGSFADARSNTWRYSAHAAHRSPLQERHLTTEPVRELEYCAEIIGVVCSGRGQQSGACVQAQAVKLEQHLKFLDESVFPLMTELLAACEAAGVPTAEAKEAAAKMQSRHKDFTEAAQRETVEAATTQTRLTEEITRISTGAPVPDGRAQFFAVKVCLPMRLIVSASLAWSRGLPCPCRGICQQRPAGTVKYGNV